MSVVCDLLCKIHRVLDICVNCVCIEYFRKKTEETDTDNWLFGGGKLREQGSRETFSSENLYDWVAALSCVNLRRLN